MNAENPAAYIELRGGTRTLLSKIGVATNPATLDVSIVNALREKLNLDPTENVDSLQESLASIVIESGTKLPDPDGRGDVLEARRLVHILYGLFAVSG